MSWSLHITRTAERDLISAADYIEFVLLNPQAAGDLLDEAEREIRALADFPERCALVEDPVLKAWGIRLLTVKNYLVFYVIGEENHTVHVVRFLYAKRNWIPLLRKGVSIE